jgi:hypothetical protein
VIRRALLAAFLATTAVAGPSWLPSAGTAAAWNSNITNANRPADVIGALRLGAEVGAARRQPLGRDDTLLAAVSARAEAWPRFDGLDRAGAGARIAWQRKFGLGAFAPTLALEGAGEWMGAREPGRAGRLGLLALAARQRLDPAWVARGRHELARHDGRATAFDRTGSETTLALEWEVTAGWRLTVSVARRRGDVLAYATPPRPDILREGRATGLMTTFDRERPMMSYLIDACSLTGRLDSAHTLDARHTLLLAAEYRETERGAVRYLNRNLSLALDRRL